MTVAEGLITQHLTLFDVGPLPHEATLDERFQAFIEANPGAVDYFARLAMPIAARGRRTGMKALFEQARYSHAAFSDPGSEFKLNNSFSSRMTRAVVAAYPDLADTFTTRALATERAA